MAEKVSTEDWKARHDRETEANRSTPIAQYKSGEKQTDLVYEVTHGYKYLPGGIKLGPGQRFHPTERQVRTGALKGKARELTSRELREVQAPKQSFAGADIGLRALPMAEGTVQLAIDAGLTEADFADVPPEGANGRYTRSQVETLIEMKREAEDPAPAAA